MEKIVDVYLNTNTCLSCGKVIRIGKTYCKECKKLVDKI